MGVICQAWRGLLEMHLNNFGAFGALYSPELLKCMSLNKSGTCWSVLRSENKIYAFAPQFVPLSSFNLINKTEFVSKVEDPAHSHQIPPPFKIGMKSYIFL